MRKVYVYLYEDMADFEVTLLLHRLRKDGGREIEAVAETLEPVKAQSGLRYWPDRCIEDTEAADAEALLIPGGPINPGQNAIIPLVREVIQQGGLVGAICFGPQFLARAGILKDFRYTTSCTEEKIHQLGLEDPFPRERFVQARVVRDGHLITAQGYAFVDFAEAVCDALHVIPEDRRHTLFGQIKATTGGNDHGTERG